jgi:hypothetical protein
MKIFYTVSKTGMSRYLNEYGLVLSELKKHKVEVIATLDKSYRANRPELKNVVDVSGSEDKYKYVNDSAVKRAIFISDAVVIEASYPSFRLGFETHLALSQQKPVLVLSKNRNYANLIDSPNFFGAKYNDFTLPDEIQKFITHVKKYKLRNRFNLFVSDDESAYLRKVSKINSVSMSSYIRKLIQKDTFTK